MEVWRIPGPRLSDGIETMDGWWSRMEMAIWIGGILLAVLVACLLIACVLLRVRQSPLMRRRVLSTVTIVVIVATLFFGGFAAGYAVAYQHGFGDGFSLGYGAGHSAAGRSFTP